MTRHIEYLITCNDCVIVPGWGAFIAHCRGAYMADDGITLMPPSRTLSFNPDIAHNDGLLVTSIVRRDDVTYDQALSAVEDQVMALRHQLEAEGEIVFPRIGRFTLSEDDRRIPVFTPADNSIAAGGWLALPRVKALPLPSTDISEISADDSDTATDVPSRHIIPLRLRRAARIAASVAAMLALGIVLTTPVAIDDDTRFASVDPSAALPKVSGPKAVNITELSEMTGFEVDPGMGELSIAVPAEAYDTIVAEMPRHDAPRYFLIVASLYSRRQAEQYLASADDPTLNVLERDGRFRVYAATGASVAEAQQLKSDRDFIARYPDAWVYKKK